MVSKRLVNAIPESKVLIVRNVFYQWCSLVMNIVLILSITAFIETVYKGNITSNHFIFLLGVLLSTVLVRFYCTQKAIMISDSISRLVKRSFRNLIYSKLSRLGMRYKEQVSTSEVTQVAVEGVDQLEIYFGNYLPQLIYSLVAPFTLFIVLSFVQFSSALILLLCVPLIPLTIMAVQKFAKRLLSKYWGEYTILGDDFLENLQGLTTLKVYDADQMKHEAMNKQAERFRKITMKVLMMQLNSIALMDALAYGGAALGTLLALLGMINGTLTIGLGLAIILLSAEFYIPMRLLGSFFHIAMNGMAASDKLFALLDIEEDTVDKDSYVDFEDQLAITDVSFSYDGSRSVLSNININIKAGTLHAVVGKSGSGKSTIASLLLGHYQNYEGAIYTDRILGLPHITYVGFNSYIFKGSVRENLNIGANLYSDTELWEVLDQVNLKDFLKQDEGLDTMIKEGASNISGGQRQRLAMARALLVDSDIYIFDEATSNIDVESETDIMNVIKKLAKTKTIILITHRLANVVDADTIDVLELGKVVESGTHETLLQENKQYAKMWHTQVNLEQYNQEVIS